MTKHNRAHAIKLIIALNMRNRAIECCAVIQIESEHARTNSRPCVVVHRIIAWYIAIRRMYANKNIVHATRTGPTNEP